MEYINLRDKYYVTTNDYETKQKDISKKIVKMIYGLDNKKSITFEGMSFKKINRKLSKLMKSKKEIMLYIKIASKELIEKAIKDIIKIRRICKSNNIQLGIEEENRIIVAHIEDYSNNKEIYIDILKSLNAVLYETKEEKYNYLYDTICEYLDNEFINKNLCDFCNDKCKAKKNTEVTMGCCHHYKNKYFGVLYSNNLQLCEHLKDKRCSAKCITCKLFTCDELKKEGNKYNTRNIMLIKCFFNPIQKIILKSSYFTTKDVIMKRLLMFA